MEDKSVFPDPVYAETVLAPLFDGVKTHFAPGMDRINRAHLVMLVSCGILSAEDGAQIAHVLRQIEGEGTEGLHYDGSVEDYFFHVEGQLKARLGDLGGALHTARSRNDMDHTLFRMALIARAEAMQHALMGLTQALIDKADAERETLIVAYTHGQPAQPSTFGHYLASIIEVMLGDLARLEAAITALDLCPMGAAAITTSGFPIDRDQVAASLGFAAPTRNSYGSIANVDYISGLYSALKLPFLHLGRVVQDFAFWSSFEVGQLYVPNALVQVSSIMPQKRNPVPIEHMRHLASVTSGRCDMVMSTLHNTPHTDMNDSEGEVQQAGFAAFDSGGRMLRLFTQFVSAVRIRADRVQQNTEAACITITELADTLVRDEGISFRQAHEVAAATSQAVIAKGAPLAEGYAAFAVAFEDGLRRATGLDEAAFRAAVAARSFVERRDRHGGPAPAAMEAALTAYAQALQLFKAQANARHIRRAQATAQLDAAFEKLKEG